MHYRITFIGLLGRMRVTVEAASKAEAIAELGKSREDEGLPDPQILEVVEVDSDGNEI